jgi:hypothetical protein
MFELQNICAGSTWFHLACIEEKDLAYALHIHVLQAIHVLTAAQLRTSKPCSDPHSMRFGRSYRLSCSRIESLLSVGFTLAVKKLFMVARQCLFKLHTTAQTRGPPRVKTSSKHCKPCIMCACVCLCDDVVARSGRMRSSCIISVDGFPRKGTRSVTHLIVKKTE